VRSEAADIGKILARENPCNKLRIAGLGLAP
jgi:hypothetical protein